MRKGTTVRRAIRVTALVMALGLGTTGCGLSAAGVRTIEGRAVADGRAWDPRILPLARFVERARGFTFLQPVPAHFLTPAAFDRRFNRPSAVRPNHFGITTDAAGVRALGLVGHGFDDDFAADRGGLVAVGVYTLRPASLWIRGATLDPYLKEVVVHELTHALQRQRLGTDDRSKTSGRAAFALRTLIEGDARRIEYEYRRQLPSTEQADITARGKSVARSIEAQHPSLVGALGTLGNVPYSLGNLVSQFAVLRTGDAGLNALIEDPPATDFWDPYSVAPVPAPLPDPFALPPSASGTVRRTTLYLVLANRIPGRSALSVVDDVRSVRYGREGDCVDLDDATTDVPTTERAFRAWAAQMATGVTVSRRGTTVRLRTCDPGADGLRDAPFNAADTDTDPTLRLVLARHLLAGRLYRLSGAGPCMDSFIVRRISVAEATQFLATSSPLDPYEGLPPSVVDEAKQRC